MHAAAAAAPGGAEGLTEKNESATHDNETSLGWFRAQPPETQALVCDYLRTSGERRRLTLDALTARPGGDG